MTEAKRVFLTLSIKLHEGVSKQAEELGLSVPDYIRYLLAKEIAEAKKEAF